MKKIKGFCKHKNYSARSVALDMDKKFGKRIRKPFRFGATYFMHPDID